MRASRGEAGTSASSSWLWGLLSVLLVTAIAPVAEAASTQEGMLRIAIDAEPSHLNPILDPDLWAYRIAHDLLCEPLLRRRASLAGGDSRGGVSAAIQREVEPV
ncbi:hypothetical protein, partial [Haliangium sp. UPWRP_2]|uniref:hypothetical protein n=1 Tax=Haliangium sp. UPWRP_2 TaxID=1931276 RepID=UPI0011B1FCDB